MRATLAALRWIAIAGAVTATPPAHADAVKDALRAAITRQIADANIPGAVVVVGQPGREVRRVVLGSRSLAPRRAPMRAETLFDLSSLTKVFTAVAVMQLVEAGRLALDQPVAGYWAEFAAGGKEGITIEQLLLHTSGLRAGLDLKSSWSGEAAALALAAAEEPRDPPGTRFEYSDINYIVLGELVRRTSGQRLDRYLREHVFEPIGMRDTGFRPAPGRRRLIAPTSVEDGALRWGEVQDPTAHRMDGVAGHAGLFSTAADLTRFCEMLLGDGARGGVRLLAAGSVAQMTRPRLLPGGIRRAFGWDVSSPYAAGITDALGPMSFGHTGYTGTMLWIDPMSRTYLIVLASRLHPDGQGDARPLRREAAMIAAASTPSKKVLPGIDVLALQNFAPLVGKRIGLVTNQSGRDASGVRTVDVLARAPGVELAAIFTPEHGLDADREGRIDSGRDATTGVVIHSLYGEGRRPDEASLAGLDALVIDIQDAGVRFFTYATTVGYVLEEAAQRDLDVYLLDRPNPINAKVVEGPLLDPELVSFTGYFPMPLRHGMTLGELATMFNAEYGIGARLHVIRMHGYRRGMWFDDTGLDWINPSPNLRTPTQAILYPGVGLVEGANVSVGRGTPWPFEVVGAPWIDGRALARALTRQSLPGVTFKPVEYVPEASRYAGERCFGVRIALSSRRHFDAGRLGIALAATLHRLHPEEFDLQATQSLMGSQALVAKLIAATGRHQILRHWRDGLRAFRDTRSRSLLYADL